MNGFSPSTLVLALGDPFLPEDAGVLDQIVEQFL